MIRTMNRESLAVGIAGIVFGLLAGWIIGSQNARPRQPDPPPAPAAAAQSTAGAAPRPAALDEAQVRTLRGEADANPKDATPRRRLGDLYFDAERYTDAITWYEASLAIDPKNPDVSTDLGVSYYYSNQPDRALAQFDRSLAINPSHTKTLLNVGVVRASAKRDLEGRHAGVAARAGSGTRQPRGPRGTAAHRDAGDQPRRTRRGRSGRHERRRMIGWALRIILFLIVLRLVLRFVRGLFQGLAPEPRTRRAETPVPLVRDPVCGIHIPLTRALTTGAGDHIQYFCSEECRRAWAARAS